jgi:tetratricopeptide (TPR) repeat protein
MTTGEWVFISYASADADLAMTLCESIEAGGGRCWIAPRDIPPGMNYAEALTDAIDSCGVFVLVFSESSSRSPNVANEIEHAASGGHPIFLVRTDSAHPQANRQLNLFLARHHWFDAVGQESSVYLPKLVEAVLRLIAQRDTDGRAEFRPTTPTPDVSDTEAASAIAAIETGRELEWAGEWAGAEDYYRNLLFAGDRYLRAMAHIRLARCLIETCDRGDTAEADDLLSQADEISAGLGNEAIRGELLLQRARLDDLEGKLRQALDRYESAHDAFVAAGADPTEAALALASAERRRGEFNKALERISSTIDPDSLSARLRAEYFDELGATLLARGEALAAADVLRRALDLDDTTASRYAGGRSRLLLAEAYLRLGRSEDAFDLIEAATEVYRTENALSGLSEAKALMGSWYEDRAEYETAIAYYLESYDLDHTSGDVTGMVRAKRRLARAYRRKGDSGRAAELVRDAFESLAEGDDVERAGLLEEKGFLAIAISADYDRAIDFFEQALQIARDDGDEWTIAMAKRNLAEAYQADDKWAEAEALLLEVKSTLEKLGDLKQLDDVFDDLGELMLECDNYARAEEYLLKSLTLDEQLGRVASKARSKLLLGRVRSRSTDQDRAGDDFENAVELYEKAANQIGLSDALKQLAGWRINQGRIDDAIDDLYKALDIDNRLDRRLPRAQAKRLLAIAARQRGNLDRSADYLEDARRDLTGIDDPPEHAALDFEEGRLHLAAGSSFAARELLESARQVFESRRLPVDAASCLRYLAIAAAHEGRYEDALEMLESARTVFEERGDYVELDDLYDDLGAVHLMRGRMDEASECINKSLALGREGSWRRGKGRSLVLLAIVAQHRRVWGEAKRHLDEALATFKQVGDTVGEATALIELGDWNVENPEPDQAEAVTRYKAARRLAQHHRNRRGIARCNRKLALVYIERGELQRADEAIEDARAELRDADDLREVAPLELASGRLAAARGNHTDAVEHYRRAIQGFTKLGQEVKRAVTQPLLVLSYQALGNTKEALETIRQMEAERVSMYDVLVNDFHPAITVAASQAFAAGSYSIAVDLAFAALERELKARSAAVGATVGALQPVSAHARAWAESTPIEEVGFVDRPAIHAFVEFCITSFDVIRVSAYGGVELGPTQAFAALSVASWIAHGLGTTQWRGEPNAPIPPEQSQDTGILAGT